MPPSSSTEHHKTTAMKFAIGYQKPINGESFVEIVADYREHLAEVYFPWPGYASGRPALGGNGEETDWGCQEQLEEELYAIRQMGIRLDLLLNANCFGARAASGSLAGEIRSILRYLESLGLLPEVVTVASIFVAHVVKQAFPRIEVRASVNMRIDSTLAMEYLADNFDSFHIRRDLQRDLPTVSEFSRWCREHGKRLCMLANSGCLRNCPAQSFHDNLVAHHAEACALQPEKGFTPHLCWKLYQKQENFEEFLRCSWIRPEDLHLYEPYFDFVKLATRQHSHPRLVLGAYVNQHYDGDLLALTEPGFSKAFTPYYLDNSLFPADWHTIAGKCATNCTHCGKCTAVLQQVLQRRPVVKSTEYSL